ncbi:MAG TPA: molybdopterin-dependent oxidoreductase [Ktedonobacterales bacterium]|nr:molybdopterin-dependent oxidoreductase [Ktedonobacterales bacterium]
MHPVIAGFVDYGFPVWLRATHWVNVLLMGLMIRSGIQILASYPRLNWGKTSKPGFEWLKFTNKEFRKDEHYITLEEEEDAPVVLAQPGGSNLGLGRHFHFLGAMLWIANGVVYYIFLFATGEWRRLVPTTWSIFPNAFEQFVHYLTFHGALDSAYLGVYDPLQQLSYFGVVFLLAPFQIATALAQSPAVEARFPWYVNLWGGRQSARSLHFIGLVLFLGFILIHTIFVILISSSPDGLPGFVGNFGLILLGQDKSHHVAAVVGVLSLIVLIFATYFVTSWLSRKYPAIAQRIMSAFIRPWMALLARKVTSRQEYKPEELSDYFIINGFPPDSPAYLGMLWSDFKGYTLEIGGLVEHPLSLTLDQIKAMPKQTQITQHNCIQGWSSIGEWGGVPVLDIMTLVKPLPNARYLVFRSYSKDTAGKEFFECIHRDVAIHPQTILAYEMNGEPLPLAHGAPLRLRAEVLLGFKMVKWIASIEFVETYANLRDGLGGSREENKHYEQAAPI